MPNKAIILLNEEMASIETNGVHLMTILQSLHNIQSAIAKKLQFEAEVAVGTNPKAQAKYLDELTKACWTNLRKGTQDIDINLN